jgi:hypothetical protein
MIIVKNKIKKIFKMFIRENKTTNKKSGKIYIKHTLVESIRTEKGPRQRTVMQLGELQLDRSYWKELAHQLESYLTSSNDLEQLSLFELPSEVIDELEKQKSIIRYKKEQEASRLKCNEKCEKVIKKVDINSLTVTECRSLGAELLANNAWDNLDFSSILTECNFTEKEIALAASVIWGRLIFPGSDLKTWKWIRNISSISDFFTADISKIHKDKVYQISDKLLKHKSFIENALYQKNRGLFSLDSTIFLFDLTNFYFEGNCKKNKLAKRGKSKEKRNNNPLVTLALIVDKEGFPVRSKIYSGNIGEPKTLAEILDEAGLLNNDSLLPFQPTLAMDRGIATKENLDFIKKNNFPYTVIERANKVPEYKNEFMALENFKTIKDSKGQSIHIKKFDNKLLCKSEHKSKKEDAMDNKKVFRITNDLEKLKKSIKNGRLKKKEKILERIGRIKERYSGFDKYFQVKFNSKTIKFSYRKIDEKSVLNGCYIIEYDKLNLNEEEIWRLYMTLTKVESAFRSLKTDLGTRPIYHQGAERTSAHLFISVLAYNLLTNIEYRLREKDDYSSWNTIKNILSTHHRTIIQWKDENENIRHKKSNSTPETSHKKIYRTLEIKNPLRDFTFQ